jgi:hypothetical protein
MARTASDWMRGKGRPHYPNARAYQARGNWRTKGSQQDRAEGFRVRHRWQIGCHSDKTSDGFIARARTCVKCGKTQVYDVASYDVIGGTRYSWQPLIGRCKPNGAVAPTAQKSNVRFSDGEKKE